MPGSQLAPLQRYHKKPGDRLCLTRLDSMARFESRPQGSPPEADTFALQDVAEHRMQDPAITVVVDLNRRIDPAQGGEAQGAVIFADDIDSDPLTRLNPVVDVDGEGLTTAEPQGFSILSYLELGAGGPPCPRGCCGGCARS